jgi:putative serine protease PepD
VSSGDTARGIRLWVIWVVAAAIAVVLGVAGGWVGTRLGGIGGSAALTTSGGSCDAESVANRVLPTIVTVNVTGPAGSVGSGEIVRRDGYIVTNNHVIAPALPSGHISVTFSNGQQHDATLVGRDATSDIAVLKVAATGLPVIGIADSDAVNVGQPVVALGAPLGLSSTVTAGIVSALGRTTTVPAEEGKTAVIVGGIQTDASINPGNSGGALVDCRGRMIGVNTAIATVPNAEGTGGGGSVGIGFAVPANRAMSIADDLIDHGRVVYPDFGISTTPITAATAEAWGMPEGLYVQTVTAGGAADRAGLRPGDVITQINGHAANHPDALSMLELTARTGDTVHITYERNGRSRTATVTL